MRSMTRMRKATILGLAVALFALCSLPGAAAPVATDDTAPSWGEQLVELVLDAVSGWFGAGDEDDDNEGGIVLEPGGWESSSECPPGQSNCEGGPDWDPNG